MGGRRYDVFAPSKSMVINPFELNNEGRGEALVLRYADCNLGPKFCPLCYAWRYAWRPKYSSRVRVFDVQKGTENLKKLSEAVSKKIVWIRIQGGEPLLNYDRIKDAITFAVCGLNVVHEYGLNFFNKTRAVIQTNVVVFNNLTSKKLDGIGDFLVDSLNRLVCGKIVFEVSFKSPHVEPLLSWQVNGFYRPVSYTHLTLPTTERV